MVPLEVRSCQIKIPVPYVELPLDLFINVVLEIAWTVQAIAIVLVAHPILMVGP